MNKCKICSKDITKDSQYINGNYYHNRCIENLEHNWNELKKFINLGYYDSYIYSSTILNKMAELEERESNENI